MKTLLEEASMLAATAILRDFESISVGLVRKFSLLVCKIANCIEEKYSHVQIEQIARKLAGRWLLHGDKSHMHLNEAENAAPFVSTTPGEHPVGGAQSSLFEEDAEADTMSFELDLSLLNPSGRWVHRCRDRWN